MNEIITTGRSLNTITAEINAITQQAQAYILNTSIELGRRLCEAKQLLPQGESWMRYLAEEVNYSKSTAENFMRIFREYGDDQQSLFGGESQTIRKLTYTKALALLALPREDRETFAIEVDAENLSTRELEAEIEKRKQAEADADAVKKLQAVAQERYEEAHNTVERLEKQQKQAEAEAKKRNSELERLKKSLKRAEDAEKAAKEEASKAKQEAGKLPEGLMEQLRAEAEADAAKAARAEAAKKVSEAEARAEQAEQAKAEAERQLNQQKEKAAGGEDLAVYRVLLDAVQTDFNKMVGVIIKTKGTNPETAAKMARATEALLTKMQERLRGQS